MITIKKNNVYLRKKSRMPDINVVQYDTGIRIILDIRDEEIPEGSEAVAFFLKPSGKSVFQAAEVEGNTVIVNCHNQAFTEEGKVEFQVSISGSGAEVTTFAGTIVVEKKNSEDAVESETVMTLITAIENALKRLKEGLDTTLTQEGRAADAKAVGDAIRTNQYDDAEIREEIKKKADRSEIPEPYDDKDIREELDKKADKQEFPKPYDDTEIREEIKKKADRSEIPEPYDDKEIREEIKKKADRSEIPEPYDDKEIREEIKKKADRTEIPAPYDDTEIRKELGKKLEEKDLPSPYDDSKVKKDISSLSESIGKKLDKPERGVAVGKVLKVKAINADGSFVCEWAEDSGGITLDDIPIAQNLTYGLVKPNQDNGIKVYSDGLGINSATDSQIEARKSNYRPIVPANLEKAVKSVIDFRTGENPQRKRVVEESDLEHYVKDTDYATGNKAGLVSANTAYGTIVGVNGLLYGWTRTEAEYKTSSNGLLMSKGTLENIKGSLVKGVTENWEEIFNGDFDGTASTTMTNFGEWNELFFAFSTAVSSSDATVAIRAGRDRWQDTVRVNISRFFRIAGSNGWAYLKYVKGFGYIGFGTVQGSTDNAGQITMVTNIAYEKDSPFNYILIGSNASAPTEGNLLRVYGIRA